MSPSASPTGPVEPTLPRCARSVEVRGLVQGVGFRPFVYRLATRLGLAGSVRNEAGAVRIALEGSPDALEAFLVGLKAEAPPLARIHEVTWADAPPEGARGFRIAPSAQAPAQPGEVPPDVATCDDCLQELFDPADRRAGYPFLNCTNCGPRLTIIDALPYDRGRTAMAAFALCRACEAEYRDPADRRFHAQPTACADCGPQLSLCDAQGRLVATADAIAEAAASLKSGRIVAIKGLGGYHLAVDAADAEAVARLRARKQRDEKPFAVMVADIAGARRCAELTAEEARALASIERPIVLARRRPDAPIAAEVAPGQGSLGLMLAYTPLHHRLLAAMDGRALVMTSGNASNEPIVHADDEAIARLGAIAERFLRHDRPIRLGVDDSVLRLVDGAPLLLRRSRGYAPAPLRLPRPVGRTTLALGGQLKATFALGDAHRAILSHHLGDLDDWKTHQAYEAAIARYSALFELTPTRVVHDMHPDYASSALARQWERERGIERLSVQHHHAHMAACLAEHGLDEPAIGVIFDGTGHGTDGAIWGGEFLVGDCAEFRRAAHMRPLPLPGGERAIREPWRLAAAALAGSGLEPWPLAERVPEPALRTVLAMAERGVHAPASAGMGRLFDAMASLIAHHDRVSFEGQAAMALEWLATDAPAGRAYGFALESADGTLVADWRPVIREAMEDRRRGLSPGAIARAFHDGVIAMIADVCARLRDETALATVALSGGVFQNALLLHGARARLEGAGFRVLSHRRVPPNDGGLALGQLAIAAARDARKAS